MEDPPASRSATESIDLIRDAQAGDLDALNRLFASYYERVRRIVRVRLGPQVTSGIDTDDILQETFIAAVRAFDSFEVRNEASLINWLSKIAENKIRSAADHMNAAKRDRRREVALEQLRASITSDAGFDPADSVTRPSDRVEKAEEVLRVERAMRELKPEHRELILHRDYAGASWEEVAELTGSPSANAARMMHARAMTELARLHGRPP